MDKAIQIEEKLFGECFETSEQRDGMQNFLNKSKSKKKAKFKRGTKSRIQRKR